MTSTSKPNRLSYDESVGLAKSTGLTESPQTSTALRAQLRREMQRCRQLTLSLFAGVERATFCCYAHLDFSPIGWHLGHIAYTEALWILEHCAGMAPLFPEYRRLFAADTLPKHDRVNLPTLAEVQAYLAAVRAQVFAYFDVAPIDQQERLWWWLLQHESQHCETVALVLALQAEEKAAVQTAASSLQFATPSPSHSAMIQIPAGCFEMGSNAIGALDNEQPVQQVFLDTYWIDSTSVTCEQYHWFMQVGGYREPAYWSAAGWAWVQLNQVTQPLYWTNDPTWSAHPVYGVSWYEAEAYANFAGKRLPTEAEWEKAASWNPTTQQRQTYPWGEAEPTSDRCNHNQLIGRTTPVTAYPHGISPYGCYDMLGNVWEWTASWFDGYPGFKSYPYRGYSQAYFDQQHRVLRGGSWVTRSWALRSSFRNWYYPHMREFFAGFRCAKD